MKRIIVKWIETPEDRTSSKTMRVVMSNSERFIEGSRFDFEALKIANDEGYTVEVHPADENLT